MLKCLSDSPVKHFDRDLSALPATATVQIFPLLGGRKLHYWFLGGNKGIESPYNPYARTFPYPLRSPSKLMQERTMMLLVGPHLGSC